MKYQKFIAQAIDLEVPVFTGLGGNWVRVKPVEFPLFSVRADKPSLRAKSEQATKAYEPPISKIIERNSLKALTEP